MRVVSLRMKQGDTWAVVIGWYDPLPGAPRKPDLDNPVDITGYTARVQIRARPGDTGTPLLALTSSPPAGLTIDPTAGTVTVHATPAQTAGMPLGAAHWECEITNGVDTYTLAAGPVTVDPQVVV